MPHNHPCSARMLIHRFESMSSSSDGDLSHLQVSPARSSVARSCPKTASADDAKTENTAAKEKDKSPIRQSIRNLFSVFTSKKHASGTSPKRAEPTAERNEAEKSLPTTPRQADGYLQANICLADVQVDLTRPPVARGVTSKLPRVALFDAPVPPIPLEEDLVELTPPRKPKVATKTCGVLLYLSHYENALRSSPSRAWLPCTVTLEMVDQAIVISWSDLSVPSETRTHTVALERCTDIRSLVGSQVEQQDTKIPLAGCKSNLTIEQFKIFELLFEGRQREKFAARTVRERARWVSAIWDAVLPSQELKASGELDPIPSEEAALNVVQPGLASQLASATEITDASYAVEWVPSKSSRPSSSASSSMYPPSKALSKRSASSSIRSTSKELCHSPSIMNLSQKSMVKQRLAQIKDMELQRKVSGSSVSSGTPSESGNTSERRAPANVQNTRTLVEQNATQKNSGLVRDGDVCSMPATRPPGPEALMEEDKTSLHTSISRDSTGEKNLVPLLEILKDHAQEQNEKVMHLGDQLACLQDELQRLPQELSCIVGTSLVPDNVSPNIQQLVTKVERKVEATTDILGAIEDKLSMLSSSLQTQAQAGTSRGKSVAETLCAIDGIRLQLRSDFPAVMAKLAQIQNTQERNIVAKDRLSLADRSKQLPPIVDLSTVLAKLDAVIALQRKAATTIGKTAGKATATTDKEIRDELSKVSAMLEQNNRVRALHTQQQADSVRYLTELNTWLEAFVNHGTSQIEGVAANVEQLCNALLCTDQLGSSTDISGRASVLKDLRELVTNAKAREESFAELQKSINALLAMTSPNGSGPGSISDTTEIQKRDQAELFRAMTKELSSEIKGERIRFVDAMKEATTINIQVQVDNLKKTLVAEVMKMSNEIGHLHEEKQAIESQIQDLLVFQDKQKLSAWTTPVNVHHHQSHLEGYPPLIHHV